MKGGNRPDNSYSVELDKIFNPKNIAIVGVSSAGFGFGSGILLSLLAIGYKGKIYAVNKNGGEFFGFKLYKSVQDIPSEIDFAIISVPAELVPASLEACRLKGAAGAEILSAGFRETGTAEGAKLEQEIKDISRKGIRVIGPNCFGIYCPKSGLTLLPGPDLSREEGPVAFLSQSGGMAIDLAHIGKWMGIRFSKVVSFGNGADLRETELLEYLQHDPDTQVICMYIEGVEDGRRFFETLKKVAATKPVIVYKGGLSLSGHRAVESHTASMGGNRIIWESALRQSNAIQVNDMYDMAHTALGFSLIPPGKYSGVAVTGGGGALGVLSCDLAERFGLMLPELENGISSKIMEALPKPGSSAKNPIDVANPMVHPSVLREALVGAAQDTRIDIQVLIQLLYHYKSMAMGLGKPLKEVVPYMELVDMIQEVRSGTGKPIVLVLPNLKRDNENMDVEEIIRETRSKAVERNILVFDDIKDAFKTIAYVSRYYSNTKIYKDKGDETKGSV